MFTAIFDGSGSPDDTMAVVVAGFVGKAEQWIEFEKIGTTACESLASLQYT
jgi:hypothetical protein